MKAFMVERYGDASRGARRRDAGPAGGRGRRPGPDPRGGRQPAGPQDPGRGLQGDPAVPAPVRPGQRPGRHGRRASVRPSPASRWATRSTPGPDKDRIGTFAELIAVAPGRPGDQTGHAHHGGGRLPPPGRADRMAGAGRAGERCGRARRSSSTPAPAASAPSPSSWRSTLGAHVATTASTAKIDLVKGLGADVVVDYRSRRSRRSCTTTTSSWTPSAARTLDKSCRCSSPAGKSSASPGPPDPAFARELGANPIVRLAMTALSFRTRRRARRHSVTYSFLFMRASGDQLREAHRPHRRREDPSRRRPRLPVRRDPRSTGIRRKGTAKAGKVVVSDDVMAERCSQAPSRRCADRTLTDPAAPPLHQRRSHRQETSAADLMRRT